MTCFYSILHYRFTLNNDVEVFNVTRDGETGAACATTLNHADVYERIEVEDWKEDGSLGNVNITITNLNLTTDLNAFNRLCPPISPGEPVHVFVEYQYQSLCVCCHG